MKGEGSRYERQTIINFNEESETATVCTASGPIYCQLLKRLGNECLSEDGERHAIFTFPKHALILPRIKAKRVMTESQRIALAKARTARGAG